MSWPKNSLIVRAWAGVKVSVTVVTIHGEDGVLCAVDERVKNGVFSVRVRPSTRLRPVMSRVMEKTHGSPSMSMTPRGHRADDNGAILAAELGFEVGDFAAVFELRDKGGAIFGSRPKTLRSLGKEGPAENFRAGSSRSCVQNRR